jgi:hypothetical protein
MSETVNESKGEWVNGGVNFSEILNLPGQTGDLFESLPLPPFKISLTVWLISKPAHDFWAFNKNQYNVRPQWAII